MNPDIWFVNIGIKIEHLSRVAFSPFGFDIYYYGLIIGLGILAGVLYATHEAKRTGQDPELYVNFLCVALIACVVGARLYFVAFTWEDYKDNLLKIFATREGGLAIYGAVIAVIPTAIWYTKKHKINFRQFADTAVPGLVLGQAIGRWGNFVNKEAFGGYTNALFAMRLKVDQIEVLPKALLAHVVNENGTMTIQVHPTFLYESLWCICIFVLMNVYKTKKKAEGELFALYFIGYGFGRFFIEGMRTDQLLIAGTNLAASQLLSAVLVLVGFVLMARYRRQKEAE